MRMVNGNENGKENESLRNRSDLQDWLYSYLWLNALEWATDLQENMEKFHEVES